MRSVNPWWKVEGSWPPDYGDFPEQLPPDVLAGSKLAQQAGLSIGDKIEIGGRKLRISGILNSGSEEDQAIVAPLHIAQTVLGQPNAVRRVTVSALTKPEDTFARKDPDKMSPAVRDRWYCSPYANSIAYQLREALPNVRVEQIRQVEQNQGKVLSRVSGLMLLLTLAALLAAALAVSAAMAATILERRQEVGLMKSLGAGNSAVASLFLTEAGLLALSGGLIGFACRRSCSPTELDKASSAPPSSFIRSCWLSFSVPPSLLPSSAAPALCARPCSLILRLCSEATHDPHPASSPLAV